MTKITPDGDIPEKKYRHTAVVYNNCMWVFGGRELGRFSNSLHAFDFATHTWKLIIPEGSTIPTPRSHHTAVVYRNKMIVFGGYNVPPIDFLLEFSFQSFKWTQISPGGQIPNPRYGHTAVQKDDDMIVFGGYFYKTFFDSLYAYNCINNKWRKLDGKGDIPRARRNHSAALIGDKMFIFGGTSSHDTRLNDVYSYDFGSNIWTRIKCIGEIPSRRSGHSAVVSPSGLMIVFGGFDSKHLNDCYSFDTTIGFWKNILDGKTCSKRRFHSAVVHNNAMYIFGGHSGNYYNDIHVFKLPEEKIELEKKELQTSLNDSCLTVDWQLKYEDLCKENEFLKEENENLKEIINELKLELRKHEEIINKIQEKQRDMEEQAEIGDKKLVATKQLRDEKLKTSTLSDISISMLDMLSQIANKRKYSQKWTEKAKATLEESFIENVEDWKLLTDEQKNSIPHGLRNVLDLELGCNTVNSTQQ